MVNLDDYVTVDFPVNCVTGVLASSVDGKLIPTDREGEPLEPGSEAYLRVKKRIRSVNKALAKPVYTRIFEAGLKFIELSILKADHLSKRGLNWNIVYNVRLNFKDYKLHETGEGTLGFWIEKTEDFESLLLRKDGETIPEGTELGDVLGIKDFELYYGNATIEDIFRAYANGQFYGNTGLTSADMRMLPFGVEIEFTGMTREAATKYMARFFNVTGNSVSLIRNHYYVKDAKGRIWRIKYDSSIARPVNHYHERVEDNEYRCELVTPILGYDDIETLQKLVRGLRKDRYMVVNSSCGLHVHVGGNYTGAALKNIYNLIASHQKLLTRALKIRSSGINHYCSYINTYGMRELRGNDVDIEQVRERWFSNNDRYRFVNFNSFFDGRGVEFRCFNSTTHAGKVKSYIQLCLAIANYARIANDIHPREKELGHDLTRMRNWLNTLGMTGEEFKTARLHLTQKLKNEDERAELHCVMRDAV